MTDFQESIRIARRTDLANYLVTNHPTEVVVTGHSVYLKAHSSIYTKFGYCGYTRFSSMETGNSIDCLVRYLNYSFRDAVNELASKGRSIPIKNPASLSTVGKSFEIPKSAQWPYNRVYAYLRQRGIPEEILDQWESKGIATWLEGFHDTEASVRKTVDAIMNHPLVPRDVTVRGFIIDSVTGALTEVL